MGVVWGLWVREVAVLERALVFGGEGAGAGRLLAGGDRLLDQITGAVDKKASPTEVCCQAKGAAQSVYEHIFCVCVVCEAAFSVWCHATPALAHTTPTRLDLLRTHARRLPPTAMAFMPYGPVLVRVRVPASYPQQWCATPISTWGYQGRKKLRGLSRKPK